MTIKAVFEAGTFASAVGKAADVAPVRGAEFERSFGIVFSFKPDEGYCAIRAVNGPTSFVEFPSLLELIGEAIELRLPSRVLGSLVGKLPMRSGSTVTIQSDSDRVEIVCGKTRARFFPARMETYPELVYYDPDALTVVENIGEKIKRVQWACAKDQTVFSGINLDGETAFATDRYVCAKTSLKADIEDVTLMIDSGRGLLNIPGDMRVGVAPGGFVLMPSDEEQAVLPIAGSRYSRPSKLTTLQDYKFNVQVSKKEILDALKRVGAFLDVSDSNKIDTFFGEEGIGFRVDNEHQGMIGEVVDVPGFCTHDRIRFTLNASYLVGAISASPSNVIDLGYDENIKMLHLNCEDYQAWISLRKTQS